MSGACGMNRLHFFLTTSCTLSKNTYIPLDAVEYLLRYCCVSMSGI